jgi:hypothetical protein
MFDLKQKLVFSAPQTWAMNPVIDQRAKNFVLHNEIPLEKDAE